MPYCEMNMHRGPSTEHNESFHITNNNTGITLNFHLCIYRKLLRIGLYNNKEKNPWKKNIEIFESKNINNEKILEICNKYLEE